MHDRQLEPSVESLWWFGAWNKSSWKVGKQREAYASGRSGRYQLFRCADAEGEGFDVRYCPPYDQSGIGQLIGQAATQDEAITLAQAHNDHSVLTS